MRRYLALALAAWLLPAVAFAQHPETQLASAEVLPAFHPLTVDGVLEPGLFALPAAAVEVVGVAATQVMVMASVDETPGRALFMMTCRETVAVVIWQTGVTAGAIRFETAESQNAAGAWAPLATATFSGTAVNRTVVQITGAMMWFRPAVETTVANGVADVWVGCN